MPDIVDQILRICAGELAPEFLEASREKVSRYIETLASTGKNSGQLTEYGLAYLKELHNPDPRYTGC
jgi:predicted HTH transcriptional regulator